VSHEKKLAFSSELAKYNAINNTEARSPIRRELLGVTGEGGELGVQVLLPGETGKLFQGVAVSKEVGEKTIVRNRRHTRGRTVKQKNIGQTHHRKRGIHLDEGVVETAWWN